VIDAGTDVKRQIGVRKGAWRSLDGHVRKFPLSNKLLNDCLSYLLGFGFLCNLKVLLIALT